jgi:hypothetical protein
MTADGRESWALGFFSYAGLTPEFSTYCRTVALALVALHDARLHWGKHFPLTHAEGVRDAYRHLAHFQELCLRYDPAGTFRGREVAAMLGIPE